MCPYFRNMKMGKELGKHFISQKYFMKNDLS